MDTRIKNKSVKKDKKNFITSLSSSDEGHVSTEEIRAGGYARRV